MINLNLNYKQRCNNSLPFEQEITLTKLFNNLTSNEPPRMVRGSDCGDYGEMAGTTFAGALWLVDHAGVFLKILKNSNIKKSISPQDDPLAISQKIFKVLSDEISLKEDQKLQLISKLLVDIGISLNTSKLKWEEQAKQKVIQFTEKASFAFSGRGYELYVLPWAFNIEQMNYLLPVEERVLSLKKSIPHFSHFGKISSLELNKWAYFLLLVGKWKAATPMAYIATELTRNTTNLDTLGWAYFFEGDIHKSISLLFEALDLRDPKKNPESWAGVAYHILYVYLNSGQRQKANDVFNEMLLNAPNAYWTKQANHLKSLFDEDKNYQSKSSNRNLKKYEYDIALSFAGEDRHIVLKLASKLAKKGVKLFYDEFEKAEFWGKNLNNYLTDLFYNKAMYCVMFISENYAKKRWTNLEREAAQARAFSEDQEYILPIRLDNTEIPGFLPTIAYIDWNNEKLDNIIKYVLEKIQKNKKSM